MRLPGHQIVLSGIPLAGTHVSGTIRVVFEALKEQITRRRALLITPFAFAGLVAMSSRRGDRSEDSISANGATPEVTVTLFNDAGEKLQTTNVPKLVRSNSEWR